MCFETPCEHPTVHDARDALQNLRSMMTFVVVAGPTSCMECTIYTQGRAPIGLSPVEKCLTRIPSIPSSCQATFNVHIFWAQPHMHTVCLDGRTLQCEN